VVPMGPAKSGVVGGSGTLALLQVFTFGELLTRLSDIDPDPARSPGSGPLTDSPWRSTGGATRAAGPRITTMRQPDHGGVTAPCRLRSPF
jgi:hypothetical protein